MKLEERLDNVSFGAGTKELCTDAATEIRRLRARVEELETALKDALMKLGDYRLKAALKKSHS